jgi:hypothetical protein
MRIQLELFEPASSPSSPLIGQHVRLNRVCLCGSNIAIIGSSSPTVHTARLSCANCGTFAGWLPRATASWLTNIISRFGAPSSSSPIDIRRQADAQRVSHLSAEAMDAAMHLEPKGNSNET